MRLLRLDTLLPPGSDQRKEKALLSTRKWTLPIAIVATSALTAVATLALAGTATESAKGKSITQVKVKSSSDDVSVQSQTETIATSKMTVPANSKALVLARFSASSEIVANNSAFCEVRILIGGDEANPIDTADFLVWDSTDGDGDNLEAHAIERWLGPLNAGEYNVKVEAQSSDGDASCAFDGWNLTLERVKA